MVRRQDNLLGINHVSGKDNKDCKLDIVFIHGLGGDALKTWGEDKETFWPSWLGEEFADIAVWSIGYDATPSAWLRDTMPMEERALNILTDLSTTEGIGSRSLCFIVHSMGGLILKYILEKSKADNNYSKIIQQTKGVVFLATPHEGSSKADFLKNLGLIFRANTIVKQLEHNASSLNRLDDAFNTIVRQENLMCFSIYETKEIRIKKTIMGVPLFGFKGLKVVDESSAKGRCNYATPLPVDKDHLEICKIQAKDELVYKTIKKFIKQILDNNEGHQNQKYLDILNGLSEPIEKEITADINQIFLIFNEDNISENKYEVTGYIQCDNVFESDSFDYTFENINNQDEQEKFLEILIKGAELVNVPIHFIVPPQLFMVNFKQWKYRGSELVKLYHIVLHNKEKFSRKIENYKPLTDEWNKLFEKLKDNHISNALSGIHSDNERFDTREEKIGICFKYTLSNYETIQNTIIAAHVGVWQYQHGSLSDYLTWIESGVCLNQLNQQSRQCDHTALLWDDMSILEKLKRRK